MINVLLLIFISQCYSAHTDTLHKYYKLGNNVYLTDVYVFFDVTNNPRYYLEEVINGIKRDFPEVRHEVQIQLRDEPVRKETVVPVSGVTYAFILAYPKDLKYLPAIRFITTNGTYTYYGVTDWETILNSFLADVRR